MPPKLVPAVRGASRTGVGLAFKIDNRSDEEILRRAREFYQAMQQRRTIRDFSDRPVAREVIEYCIRAAGTAPSGANLQPWHFVAVSDLPIKHEIRIAAEK